MKQLKRLERFRRLGGHMPPRKSGEAHSERVREGCSSGLTLHVRRAGLDRLLPGPLPHAVPRDPCPAGSYVPSKREERSPEPRALTRRADVQNAHESRFCREGTAADDGSTSARTQRAGRGGCGDSRERACQSCRSSTTRCWDAVDGGAGRLRSASMLREARRRWVLVSLHTARC